MILLRRLNVKLDRDVIFLAEAGEESTTRFGIDYMVAEHWSEIEAEYALARQGPGGAGDCAGADGNADPDRGLAAQQRQLLRRGSGRARRTRSS